MNLPGDYPTDNPVQLLAETMDALRKRGHYGLGLYEATTSHLHLCRDTLLQHAHTIDNEGFVQACIAGLIVVAEALKLCEDKRKRHFEDGLAAFARAVGWTEEST